MQTGPQMRCEHGPAVECEDAGEGRIAPLRHGAAVGFDCGKLGGAERLPRDVPHSTATREPESTASTRNTLMVVLTWISTGHQRRHLHSELRRAVRALRRALAPQLHLHDLHKLTTVDHYRSHFLTSSSGTVETPELCSRKGRWHSQTCAHVSTPWTCSCIVCPAAI